MSIILTIVVIILVWRCLKLAEWKVKHQDKEGK